MGPRDAVIWVVMSEPIQLSSQAARRFVLGKQGLWPGRRWAGKAGTLAAIRAVEHLQLDPLVILARSHDLMLHSRVIEYRQALFDEIAYEDRACFDCGGWLAVQPIEELPYWRTIMRREAAYGGMLATATAYPAAIELARRALAEQSTVSGRDFPSAEGKSIVHYRGSKETTLALYYLWRTGEAMTHHRAGFERVYCSPESGAPSHLLEPAADDAADRFMARKSVAFAGISGRIGPLSNSLRRPVTRAEEAALKSELIESGEIVAIEVEGWRGRQFVLGSDLALLSEVAHGGIPKEWTPLGTSTEEEVTFLSPLDPVSARGRARTLFDFDYVWEIYKRPSDMKFGRYTMPILWGDDLVGRLDARMDRKSGTLVVTGAWLEDDSTGSNTLFLDALRAGMRRMMLFLGTSRIDVGSVSDRRLRTTLCR